MVGQNADFQAKNEVEAKDARDRLLDAAEKLFSERGFAGTSVRDLTTAAGCNIAAVNYHFGGKDKLYIEMFRRHMEGVFADHRANIEKVMTSDNPTLEKLLGTLIRAALEDLTEADGKIPMLKLTVQESLNPQLEEEIVALEMVRQFLTHIRDALMKLLPGLDEEKAMLCVFSLEGLVLHPLLFSDFYCEFSQRQDVKELVGHIVRFAAAGIREAAGCEQMSG